MTRRFRRKIPRTDYEDKNWQLKYGNASLPPCTELKPSTQIVFIGLPGYGVKLHERLNFWTIGLLRELNSLIKPPAGKKQRRRDLSRWKDNGIQIFGMDTLNTYKLLVDIKYKHSKKRKMCVILVGKEVQKYYPAIMDHKEVTDNILLMRLTLPGTRRHGRAKYIEQFVGSGVFHKCKDFLGWPLDKFKV